MSECERLKKSRNSIYEEATNQETAAEDLDEDIEQVQHNVAGLVQSWEK